MPRISPISSVSPLAARAARSRSVSAPSSAYSSVVTGSLRLRSMRTYTRSLLSNSKSSQDPRYGMTRAANRYLPLECVLPLSWSKNTPGLRCIWLTMTRSVPLMMNVPLSVISGMSPM